MFFRGSRYEAIAHAELATADGRVIRYKRVRFIPDTPGTLSHPVAQGDRVDLIAYQFFNDPEQFWRICDANLVFRPEELVAEPGRRILIPFPTG